MTLASRRDTLTAEQTEALGAALARALPPGGLHQVVYLCGDLGAGKTTLVRGLLHADLYRLRDPGELEAIGLRDYAGPGHLWLVEWPEKGAGHLPPADLSLSLTVTPDAHQVELQGLTPAGEAWLARLDPA